MSSDGAKESLNWRVKKLDGSRLEPANLAVLRQWVSSGQIEPDDLIINDSIPNWVRAAEVVELFDLFEGEKNGTEPPSRHEESPEVNLEIPDCAYHPGKASTEICVGCGKFVCADCGDRFENKFYCRRCLAEKQVIAESGAGGGSGAIAQIIPGIPSERTSRLSIASIVFAAVAFLASFLMLIPGYRLAAAPAVGFISFLAALLGAVGLGHLRSSRQQAARSKQFALAGLVLGFSVLILSVVSLSISIREFRSGALAQRSQNAQIVPQTGRRQPSSLAPQDKNEREANARQLLEQLVEYLNSGKLEEAVSTARTLVGLYPDTKAGEIVEARLPALEQALGERQAVEKQRRLQHEELARQTLEQALQADAKGDRLQAIDLLKKVVTEYPETEIAARANAELQKIETAVSDQRAKSREKAASLLAAQARERMAANQYDQAAQVYRQIFDQYGDTKTAASSRAEYQHLELILSDPSERRFVEIQKDLPNLSYDAAIKQLQTFLAQYSNSDRFEEAKALLQQDQANKSIADSLYTFGKAYMAERKYAQAVGRYEKLLQEHPRSELVPQAQEEYQEALEKLKE